MGIERKKRGGRKGESGEKKEEARAREKERVREREGEREKEGGRRGLELHTILTKKESGFFSANAPPSRLLFRTFFTNTSNGTQLTN